MAQTILVVDDERAIRKALQDILAFEGYKVEEATDGQEAWKLIEEHNYDCVISDIKMPKMDGIELLMKVQQIKPELPFVLIRRTEDGKAHSGQVSFPGGRMDTTDPDLQYTAMRELEEEVGVTSSSIQLLGALSPLYIPVSNFHVYPFVGFSQQQPVFQLSEQEVSKLLIVSLNDLFHTSRKTKASVTSPAEPNFKRIVNAYQLNDGSIIWGATAMILAELETIFAEITSSIK